MYVVCVLALLREIYARGFVLYTFRENILVVNVNKSQSGVGLGVIVSVAVGVGVREAVVEGVSEGEGVYVSVGVYVKEAVGVGSFKPGFKLIKRDTRNCSTMPR
jgi:hypothetical protein